MSKLKLGELLIQEGKIDQVQLQSALGYQRRWGKKLGECLIQMGFIEEITLCQTLSKALKVPLIDLTKLDAAKLTKELLGIVSLQIARSQRIVPIALREIKGKKRLVVATSDPTNYKYLDEVQFKSGFPLLTMVAPDSDIEWFIRKYYLGEIDALPLNYISGISPIEGKADDKLVLDPVSSIFFDAEFTGMTNIGSSKTKGGLQAELTKNPKDSKERK